MLHVWVHKRGPPSFVLDLITLVTGADVHNKNMMLIMQSNEEEVQALVCNLKKCLAAGGVMTSSMCVFTRVGLTALSWTQSL